MELQIKRQKYSMLLFWFLFFIYTSNILGKTSFSAATVALIDESILTKTQAGLISGAFWLIYGIGQLVGGFLANKMSAYVMLNITITGSVLANVFMAFTEDYLMMLVIWSLGSVTQFGLWPAVLKLVSTEVLPEHRMMALNRLAFCFCLGSVLSYMFTALILATVSWKYIFVVSGLANVIMLFLSVYASSKLSPVLKQADVQTVSKDTRTEKLSWELVCKSGLIFFCILMVIKSIADNGIKSWMPTIMMETYGASPSYTSLLSVVLLVTNIFGVIICNYIYNHTKCDELKTLVILYLAILPMVLILLGFTRLNIIIVTVIMSLVTLLLYGSGQILQMNYPNRFHRYGFTPLIGGIINCFAAVGNVIATYGCGFVADNFGWGTMIIIWNVLMIIFVIIAVAMFPMWRKFRRKE